MIYIQLPSNSEPPDISSLNPFKSIVIIEDDVSNEWQNKISDWLVESGCKYMMSWGLRCSTWDDSIDWSCIAKHKYEKIPMDQFVITTWHENELLDEVFYYAKNHAQHDTVQLDSLVIVHISSVNKSNEFNDLYISVESQS